MKKGVSQIDWIVSLTLFLLYIVWFFIFVSPQLSFNQNKDASIEFLKEEFYDEFRTTIQKTPVFVESNYTGFVPVIMENNFGTESLRFMDSTNFAFDESRLVFLSNMTSSKKTYWVLNNVTYSQDYVYQGISVSDDSASTTNLSINLEDSLLKDASYKEGIKIYDSDYWINGEIISPEDSSYSDYGFSVFYTTEFGNINLTTYVFYGNPRIYVRFSAPEQVTYTMRLRMELEDYGSYYSDNLEFGDFSYDSEAEEISYNHSKITFYDDDSLTIFFDGDADFNLTDYNNTLIADMEFEISDSYLYEIVFHTQGNDIQQHSVNVKTGVSQDVTGLGLSTISTDYLYLKDKWGIPQNFYIEVYENSSVNTGSPEHIIGEFDPGRRTVYAETIDYDALGEEGEFTPVSVNFMIW